MQIFKPYDAPSNMRTDFFMPSDCIMSLEKIDTTFDKQWSIGVFNAIATHLNKADLIRTYTVTGKEIGSEQFPNSKFFIQIC